MDEFLAVYTIADPKAITDAIQGGGRGRLSEGRPWKRALDWLQGDETRALPLLLGNAALVNGVEWVAYVEQIEISDGKTVCTFKNLRKLSRRIPLDRLHKASDGEPLSSDYRRPYVPCLMGQVVSRKVLESLNSGAADPVAGHPKKHYVQYHNTDKTGSRPTKGDGYFSIFSSKHIKNLIGQKVWLISGEGGRKKTFYLESVFGVDGVRLGEPNVAYGANGLAFDPPIMLSGHDWFEDFKTRQQNFSLGVREVDAPTAINLENLVGTLDPAESRALRLASEVSPTEFLIGLKRIEEQLTPAQAEMLLGHANSPKHLVSLGKLATLAGCKTYEAANVQYGKVGALLADALGVSGLNQKTQMIAVAAEAKDDAGHWQWAMRPALVQALRELWPAQVLQMPDELTAAAEVESDPQCQDLNADDRFALVKARIGQGLYRRELMNLWGGKCAVTGCDVDAVLIASHAKPWSVSKNEERLDPFNGFLLAASVDRLFDKGMISFADDGGILIGQGLTDAQLAVLGLSRQSRLSRLTPKHLPYLRSHREQVFRKGPPT